LSVTEIAWDSVFRTVFFIVVVVIVLRSCKQNTLVGSASGSKPTVLADCSMRRMATLVMGLSFRKCPVMDNVLLAIQELQNLLGCDPTFLENSIYALSLFAFVGSF